MKGETVRKVHYRDMYLCETESAVTSCAIEMCMLIINIFPTVTVVGTDTVFQGATTVIHGMDQSVEQEECQCPGDCRFVNSGQ